ncbi:nlpB/DapX lipofamily protein, partial [Vibrio harveyi]
EEFLKSLAPVLAAVVKD